jgi:hypothetical protein
MLLVVWSGKQAERLLYRNDLGRARWKSLGKTPPYEELVESLTQSSRPQAVRWSASNECVKKL